MISCSHWGLYPSAMVAWEEFDEEVKSLTVPYKPSWWAGSAAYQHLNFGPYLS